MHLLVVEDEPRMATLLARGLREEGWRVRLAESGPAALELATATDYDALVLDVMLPDLSGLEVCRELRRRGRTMPVLMLTARDAVSDRVAGLDAGADDYLLKPFAFAELAARLRSLRRRAPASAGERITVGDLVLDIDGRAVTRAGTPVALSPREFDLLALLAKNAGQVLSRRSIVDLVWDGADEPESNVVDQYVAYLRRKLDRPFGRADLQTVRGVGYRWRHPSR